MRWFKHMCASHTDEILSELIDEFGAEGYGVWWIILEIIAHQMDESDRTFARFSVKVWANSARISAKKFQNLIGFLEKKGRISTKIEGQQLTIDCPNLLKFRDEWTERKAKTSKKTPDSLPSNSGVSQEILRHDPDTELQKTDTEKEKKLKQKKEKSKPADAVFEVFEHWQKIMNHKNAKLDLKRKTAIEKALSLGYQICDLKRAIEGCATDPWHQGENERKTKFDGLTLILRDAEHIEKFKNLKEHQESVQKVNDSFKAEVVSLYNKIIATLPNCLPVNVFSDQDLNNLRAIVKNNPDFQNYESWEGFFMHVRNLKRLTGQEKLPSGEYFKVSLSYILRDKNFADICNGVWN